MVGAALFIVYTVSFPKACGMTLPGVSDAGAP